MRSVIPWSYSSYNDYNTCPYRFYKERILKEYVQPLSEPVIWGNTVHKAIERYIQDGVPMPATMKRFTPIVDRIVSAPGDNYVELEAACTVDLRPTGFWDDDAWCRGKIDLLKVNGTKALNTDWKTGKVKENSQQLEMSTAMAFVLFPQVEVMTTMFMWFQRPSQPTSAKFTRDQLQPLIDQFKPGVEAMEWSQKHDAWPKKPSGLCREWCPVKDCEYHGKGNPRYGRR